MIWGNPRGVYLMAIPLLIPREQCKYALMYERELRPFAGIMCPELGHIRGKGCKDWKGVEVFAVDEIPADTMDRLRQIGVDLTVVGPIVWENMEAWRVDAMSRLRILRWMGGDNKVYYDALSVRGILNGYDKKVVGLTIRSAISDGVITMSNDRLGRYLRLSTKKTFAQLRARKKNHGTEPTQGCALPPSGVTPEDAGGTGTTPAAMQPDSTQPV